MRRRSPKSELFEDESSCESTAVKFEKGNLMGSMRFLFLARSHCPQVRDGP